MTILHAQPTNTLFHAHATEGELNTGAFTLFLTDENGVILADENGELLLATTSDVSAIVLHAQPTNTLFHAEKENG